MVYSYPENYIFLFLEILYIFFLLLFPFTKCWVRISTRLFNIKHLCSSV